MNTLRWGRRRVVKTLALAGVGLCAGPRLPAAWAAGQPLRIGIRPGSSAARPLQRALDAGYLPWEAIGGGLRSYATPLELATALARGQVDVAPLPPPLFFALHLGTGPFAGSATPLRTWQVAATEGSVLAIPATSPIAFSRQLRGKTIGVADRLDMPWLLADLYLQLSGLTPSQDVTWRRGAPAQFGAWLTTGAADAVAGEEAALAPAVAAGTARVLLPLRRLWADHPSALLTTSQATWERSPQAVERLALSTVKSARDLLSGVEAADATGKLAFPSGFDPFPYGSSLRIVLEELRKRRLTPLDTDLGKVADTVVLGDLTREAMAAAGLPPPPPNDLRAEQLVGCCYTFN